MLKDEWVILDVNDNEIGVIKEESTIKALVRRFVDAASLLMPQQYLVEMNGQQVSEFKQTFNPFIQKLNIDFSYDPDYTLDRRLGMAAAILLLAIEGKQN